MKTLDAPVAASAESSNYPAMTRRIPLQDSFPKRLSSPPVSPKPQARSSAVAVFRKVARMFMLAWGILCFYSALRIFLSPSVSMGSYLYIMANFLIGAVSWAVACRES